MQQPATQFDGTFTVDVEDYFHVSAFASTIRPADWDHYECRVEQNTRRVLDLAAAAGTQGTFFVLGWVAERYPELVREIRAAGHEIGCHSHRHQLIGELGPAEFRRDLVSARDVLQDLISAPVTLYRAPSFSVTRKTLWALEILAAEGFRIDSSIYPIRHDRYGIPDAPLKPHLIQTPAGPICEFPGMVCRIGRANVPVGGGGYLRLFPWMITKRLLHSVREQGRLLNVYIHPWEFDPDQPRIAASLLSRFRHYQNLSTTSGKIENLFREFRLGPMSAVLDSQPPAISGASVSTGAGVPAHALNQH